MIYTNYSEFQERIKLKRIELEKRQEMKQQTIKMGTGETFKQVTLFEEITFEKDNSDIVSTKFGAWFVSEKNAIFLTPEDISDLVKNKKAVVVNQ